MTNGHAPPRRTVRGIAHCHTDLSYDSSLPLAELCGVLRGEGFHFVALTEHDRGVTADRYRQYVAACRRVSDDDFVAIPGLEVLCDAGVEIAGLGLTATVESGSPDEVTARIRALGGYAIWVHPAKRGPAPADHDCDAIEVLNGKVDGNLFPNLKLVDRVLGRRDRGAPCHAIFGLDLHDLGQERNIWVECRVDRLSPEGVLAALCGGDFTNRVAGSTVTSTGRLGRAERLRLSSLEMASRCWNSALDRASPAARKRLHSLGRPIITWLKRPR
jgi:hypothetical protein